jgi:hypothetical protein
MLQPYCLAEFSGIVRVFRIAVGQACVTRMFIMPWHSKKAKPKLASDSPSAPILR